MKTLPQTENEKWEEWLGGDGTDTVIHSTTRPPEQFKTVDTDLHFSRKFATQAPKMINISKADIERGCIDIRFWIKDIENERDLEKLQRESNWTAYQEALRLLNQAETQRDELLAALNQAFHLLPKSVVRSEIQDLLAKCEANK